jgi:4,5-dihydroxyphthalate decarboxylase
MAGVPLTLAVAHYDRHVPLIDGTVGVEGVDLTLLEVGQSIPGRDGERRHERMLQNGEFDVAEISLSSYLMARDRDAPFIAIPVVPRRLFSQSLFFCRADAPIQGPQDLAGKRVGVSAYQVTLSVLAKGDLAHEHGVDWKSITWVTNKPEIVEFDLPAGVKMDTVPPGETVDSLLLKGDLDAAVLPHPPTSIIASRGATRRVFPDYVEAERAYARRNGYWPIMHFVAFRQDVVERYPWAPLAFYRAFSDAREKTFWHWEDPNWSLLAWGRHYLEEEQDFFGGDAWAYGIARNRASLERFMVYSREQGLIKAPLTMERLFHASVLDT